MKKTLMSGNEAIARGAYEAGVHFAAAYPGTPSTEILENVARYDEIDAQWSGNEKVALEVGIGASIAGSRVLVAMKHVGVNVAADPLMTFSYTGVNGGLVLVAADDPGMHSSQNEQDSRHYARLAKVPMLEPSDSQEAKDMVAIALDISEEFDTPVMLKSSTRISHAQTLVEQGERTPVAVRPYQKDLKKNVMIPAYARLRHVVVEERMDLLRKYVEQSPLNRIEWRDKKIGVICAGICYQYVREALPEASVLKLGINFPLPEKKLEEFASGVDQLYVVEELDPFMEEQIKAMGIKVRGKEDFPVIGEIFPNMIADKILGKPHTEPLEVAGYCDEPIPMRPPVLCPGCTHRSVFYMLKKLKMVVSGDIGCYTLGSLAPLEAMDTCVCMGASVSAGLGFEKGNADLKGKVVAVIGDSTFFHSGMTGLADVVYNRGTTLTMILDNRITAMTGHQHHPGTGSTLKGDPTLALDISAICKALGVERIREADPFNLKELEAVIKEEAAADEPSVIIVRRMCTLQDKSPKDLYEIDKDKCVTCGRCMKLGCPAISQHGEIYSVDSSLCVGCAVCVQVCKSDAIVKAGGDNA
ncbi:indolepyruvate ferredoxin oxidoreductase subunit alpha [Dethiobacter alkaliphilus]|uniref:indolepyruvate ferredoxin oxidoreductase subunit alpha n=1 Tax=Dethiobacter alkaliphilus TaxID=427926 RepID=UPI0022261BC8|nr:indolepyruvate ferredoxin oxidoreductase subunit alpha [Dethiobacter alkaliphilus]MCW3488706.1 indolepyruvate ferredoxin oxidoreductase subunit alpha [Dethiobacter alkaliphilus]